ncbi:uncharacterized protein LOC142613491 [Castanea sativa]|uniref:uncharacterized protein LOC142613491 n=1 Tax=Castanea sativa TaxID=21020 RepID=UPI003F64D912
MWIDEQGCHDTAKSAWEAIFVDPPITGVMQNVDTCKTQLQAWSKKSFCNVVNTLSGRKKNLKKAEEAAVKGGSVEFFLQLKAEASQQFRRNNISEFRDSQGTLASGDEEVSVMIVWRLIHDKESLFYRVFKAKYFPNSLILEAKPSTGSFSWKSMLWFRDLIEKGAIQRIGSGESVRIYEDAWLPSPEGRISSPALHLAPDSTVDSLINSTTGWWNINLIDFCFYPPEAKLIKSRPPQPDTLVWRAEKSGNYSVKSGYKLLCELHTLDTNRPQVSESQRGFWKSIWKLKVPQDQAFSSEDSVCPRCSGESETVVHALWSCACIKVVWETDFDWVDRSSATSDSFLDVYKKSDPNLPYYPCLQRRLGHFGIREINLASKKTPCPFAILLVLQRTTSANSGAGKSSFPQTMGCSSQVATSCSGLGEDKMYGESDKAGIGVVIRNSEGQVLAALSEQIVKPPTVEILELLAARRAVTFTAELGHAQFVCEGDSESVVNSLKGSGMENSRGGHLIRDIISQSNSFQSISFAHVGRQGNAVAHALAQRARQSFSSQIWLECVPLNIISFVLDDCPNS